MDNKKMVKIKTANQEKYDEKERLAAIITGSTHQLEETHRATLELFDYLNKEHQATKKSKEKLRESEQRYRLLIETAAEGILVAQGEYLKFVNPILTELTGRTEEELLSIPFIEFIHPDDRDLVKINYLKRMTGQAVDARYRFRMVKKDMSIKWAEMSGVKIEWEGKPAAMYFATDITKRKLAENRIILSSKILNLLNTTAPLTATSKNVISLIQSETGFEAIGIRLKNGDDYPYFMQIGFSDDFLQTENSLVEYNKEGGHCKDKSGNLSLECTCGMVISGMTDPTSPLFTKGGSFYTNNSSVLLELPAAQDPRHNPRNRCIHDGFNSFALVPIRANGEIIGLLQLNDRKKDCFTQKMILFFESIGAILGVALMRKQTEEALEQSQKLLFKLSEQVPGVIYQFRIYADGRATFPYSSLGINDIYELSPEDVREDASHIFERIHPDDIERVSNLIEESARNLSHFFCEYRVILPKKGLRWLYCTAMPERMEDKSTLWHGMIYNITERKQREEELRNSQADLEEAQRIAHIGSWNFDRKSNTVKWSKELNRVFDFSPDNEGGKPDEPLKVIHPDDLEFFYNSVNGFISTGVSAPIEIRVIHKDGSIHNILIESRIETNKNGDSLSITGTAQDITERKMADEERSALEQLHQFTQYTEKVRENERIAISRELHDDLGQALTAVKIDLGMIKQHVTDAEVGVKITKVTALVGDAIKTVQRITSQLRTEIIGDLGLEAAIQWYTEEFAQRYGVEFKLDLDSGISIPPDSSLIIFRIMQESLTNVARHSKASHVDISMSRAGENINFILSDNGIGITQDELKAKNSFGLMGMKERAVSLGGTFDIYPNNGSGTIVKLIFPLTKI